jgi:hypothetical protein
VKRLLLVLLLAAASPAHAQIAVDGKWTGTIAGPQGDQPITLSLAAEGETVTGTISNFQGSDQPIEDGLIQGDTLSFYQTLDFNGSAFELFYSAVAKAGDLLFRLEVPGLAQPLAFVMKRLP